MKIRPTVSSTLRATALLALAATLPSHARGDVWRWQGQIENSTIVDIELVRGQVRVERAPRAEVQIEATVSAPAIALHVAHAAGRLQVRDFYQVRSRWFPMHECLPPPGEHGDFADSDGKVKLVVHAPPGVVVNVRVLADY